MVLQSNVDVMTALQRYYVGLKANKDFPSTEACQGNIDSFAADLDVIIDELKMHISRAKLLAGTISDRKELVSFDPNDSCRVKTRLTCNSGITTPPRPGS